MTLPLEQSTRLDSQLQYIIITKCSKRSGIYVLKPSKFILITNSTSPFFTLASESIIELQLHLQPTMSNDFPFKHQSTLTTWKVVKEVMLLISFHYMRRGRRQREIGFQSQGLSQLSNSLKLQNLWEMKLKKIGKGLVLQRSL